MWNVELGSSLGLCLYRQILRRLLCQRNRFRRSAQKFFISCNISCGAVVGKGKKRSLFEVGNTVIEKFGVGEYEALETKICAGSHFWRHNTMIIMLMGSKHIDSNNEENGCCFCLLEILATW